MVNDPESARAYHERTKHTFESVRGSTHRLQWEIQPLPFKIYTKLVPIPLPRDVGRLSVATLDAIAATAEGDRGVFDVRALAAVLRYSAGITKERVYGDRRTYFRAAPCTGALYHIDVYVVCGDIPGAGSPDLPAGVYHFGPHDFALRQLRAGDHRGVLVAATAAEPSVRPAPVTLIFASTFWRNAWKYQSRAYRHCWWDSGTMIAHALAVAAAEKIPARVVTGFVDHDVTLLAGLDEQREAALALVTLGRDSSVVPLTARALPPLDFETQPLSSREVDYPAIREMHAASSLPDAESVRRWREGDGDASEGAALSDLSAASAIELPTLTSASDVELDRTIAKRGSTRVFARAPIPATVLGSLLQSSLVPVSLDVRPSGGAAFDDVYLILSSVDGMAAGTYVVRRPDAHGAAVHVDVLRPGNFRREAGYLGLGQDIPADASVNVYFLSSLGPLLARYGARGYRIAQLEAAIHGGRVYLAAYALGLGASGLTFFDDDVTAFFSPDAEGKSVMFLVAVGVPRKRGIPGA
jgi:SagB-type dehydrogenase family enzyme